MNPKENPVKCEVCNEEAPSVTHSIYKNGVIQRICTDCLLKEHRDLFCSLCFIMAPHEQRITCHKCTSTDHVSCLRPSPSLLAASSSSSSSSLPPLEHTFTCPPCTDPNFTFYPKSYVNTDETSMPIRAYWSKALVVAAHISADIMKQAAAQLKEEALKKIMVAKEAKMKAKVALGNFQDLVNSQKTSSPNVSPTKEKNNES